MFKRLITIWFVYNHYYHEFIIDIFKTRQENWYVYRIDDNNFVHNILPTKIVRCENPELSDALNICKNRAVYFNLTYYGCDDMDNKKTVEVLKRSSCFPWKYVLWCQQILPLKGVGYDIWNTLFPHFAMYAPIILLLKVRFLTRIEFSGLDSSVSLILFSRAITSIFVSFHCTCL